MGEGFANKLIINEFGQKYGLERLKKIKLICISHIHSVQFFGLSEFLRFRYNLLRSEKQSGKVKPLVVLGPKPLENILFIISQIQTLNYYFIDCFQSEKT